MLVCLGTWIARLALAGDQESDSTVIEATATSHPWDPLSLPSDFAAQMKRREAIDRYGEKHYATENPVESGVLQPEFQRRPIPHGITVVHSSPPVAARRYRQSLREPVKPLRGYRAPILENATRTIPFQLDAAVLTPAALRASGTVEASLAKKGLLVTLCGVLRELGPDRFVDAGENELESLWAIGFPVDLLSHFGDANELDRDPARLVRMMAEHVARDETGTESEAFARGIPFTFQKAHADYVAVEETGAHEVGVIRMQVGGGYRHGIVPGGSIDVAGQIVAAFPRAEHLISLPEEFLTDLRGFASQAWPLTRNGQVQFIPEPSRVSAWVQDNGKAGYFRSKSGDIEMPVTLAPRYATLGEVHADFLPGDSFLMDGLRAAGHEVIQSSLLFQGGNLLVIALPPRGERLLLIAQTEIYRNTALGFTEDQVLEAFRIEFHADRCQVIPTVSYHLDYDVNVRVVGGEIRVFVNDPVSAARMIVETALSQLEKSAVEDAREIAAIRADLTSGNLSSMARGLANHLERHRNDRGQYRADYVRRFAVGIDDAPTYNFQCFLSAADLLAATLPAPELPELDESTRDHWQALRGLLGVAEEQKKTLRAMGWNLIAVPSLPDLYAGINYLNGIHDLGRYLIPEVGGLYRPLDIAAANTFAKALGPGTELIPIRTAEAQRQHGALHCLVSVYPKAVEDAAPGPPRAATHPQ